MTQKRHNHREAFERLYEAAEAQEGYFTTKQAVAAGFDEKNHAYHVRSGNWIREHRGIYRLAKFPPSQRPDLILWYLWSRNRNDEPQGVYSHETALSLYDLSDINPAKLHMTVPAAFRRMSAMPKGLVLHRGIVHDDEIERRLGVRVTRPLKTIADLLATRSVQMDHMRQAVQQAFQRGLIVPAEFERAGRISDAMKKEIRQLRGGR
jgi:predicted transcriptional regulator of viral defense system